MGNSGFPRPPVAEEDEEDHHASSDVAGQAGRPRRGRAGSEIIDPTDVIIRVTSTGLCGSDLHLYEVLGPFMDAGDVLGHEPMGIVEEVGPGVTELASATASSSRSTSRAAHCFMCGDGLHSQCETTQVREYGTGAALFGYTKLYGQVPGGQAEYLRVPSATVARSRCPKARPTTASSTSPTCCRPPGRRSSTPTSRRAERRVLGLGPDRRHGGAHRAAPRRRRVIGVDLVPERLARGRGARRRDRRPARHDDASATRSGR